MYNVLILGPKNGDKIKRWRLNSFYYAKGQSMRPQAGISKIKSLNLLPLMTLWIFKVQNQVLMF